MNYFRKLGSWHISKLGYILFDMHVSVSPTFKHVLVPFTSPIKQNPPLCTVGD